MTEKQAYKAGFLLRCAERGLSEAETEKLAAAALEMRKAAGLGDALGRGAELAVKLPLIAGGLALGGGLATGVLGGKALARAVDPPADIESINRQELIDAYNEYAAEMEARIRERTAKS